MKTIESKQGIKGMLFVFVLLACFQNVQLLSISEYAALKPVHLFSLLFLPLLFRKKEVKINRILLVYIAYLVVVSLANLQKFGLHSLLLNYLLDFTSSFSVQTAVRFFRRMTGWTSSAVRRRF